MQENSNVVKFKKRRSINIGVIIFIIILIYVVLNVYLYATKPQISIYEVNELSLAQDNVVTGIITRSETLVNANSSGYVNYYFRDNSKVAKGNTVYSIDESKRIYEKLTDSQSVSLNEDDTLEIKQTILKYKKKFDESNFSLAYDFRDDVSSHIRELIDQNLLASMQTITSDTGISSSFAVVKADQTGVISYYSDTYDGLQESGISAAVFNQENWQRKSLRSSEVIESSSPVYKLITDDKWAITALITQEFAEKLKDRKQVTFTVEEDNLKIKAPITVYSEGSEWYLKISMDKYVTRYAKERYLTLDLSISSESGLKIPNSAIVEKEFYMIPVEYFTKGGNSEQDGLMVESYDEATSQVVPVFTSCEIYFEDETYAYVDEETFSYGQYIQNVTSGERFQISMVGKLSGVYNVNKGYAVFRRIEPIQEGTNYVVVKKGTEKGLSLYDHIALNADLITDSSVIY